MEPFDDQTKLVLGLFAVTRFGQGDAWAGFLALLKDVVQAEGTSLTLDDKGQTQCWQDGRCPDLGLALRQALRFGRVYAQDSLPHSIGQVAPLRAIRVRAANGAGLTLCFVRSADQRDFRSMDGQLLSGLAPFLGQALDIWREKEDARTLASITARMLAALGGAWVMFDLTGVVLSASPLALDWSDASGLGVIERQRLKFPDPFQEQAFNEAFMVAAAHGDGAVVTIQSAPCAEMAFKPFRLNGAEVIIGRLRIAPLVSTLQAKGLAAHFGIKISEARLASLICDGHSLKSAASKLGWTEESARTCSKTLFARIGANGQPALVSRILNSSAWFTAAP